MQKTKTKKYNKKEIIITIIGGAFIGFINGFFGGGGGMIVVPLLIFLLKFPEKKAHATAIFIILPLSIASSIVYLINGFVEVESLLSTGAGVVLGGILGAFLLSKISNKVLRIVFSIIMIAAGIKLIF